jgi:hypothetical protein
MLKFLRYSIKFRNTFAECRNFQNNFQNFRKFREISLQRKFISTLAVLRTRIWHLVLFLPTGSGMKFVRISDPGSGTFIGEIILHFSIFLIKNTETER